MEGGARARLGADLAEPPPYPIHPEILRRFSGDWSVLDKFQRTRGILKIMASAVYGLWSGESTAPLIMPALLPFRDTKVRTALLEPLHPAFGPILQSEVDGDQSLAARIEAQRPRLLKARAATLAARAVFFATAPHAGAASGGMSGTYLRLACAQPDDQIAIYGEALQEIAARAAHLYRDGDSYWFSPQPTLNKLVTDRARDVTAEQADQRMVEVLREEQRSRAGFPRVHAAPDDLTDIEDRRSVALVILPPAAVHDTGAGPQSPAAVLARETIARRGTGQRRFRNSLVFVAADATNIDAARENARREIAWRSILKDDDLKQNLTQAQIGNAEKEEKRSRDALHRSIRGAWVHILHPGYSNVTDDVRSLTAGYVMRSTRLVNRGGGKSVPQAVWERVSTDGTVIGEIGPDNLLNSLEPVWPADQPHLPIEEIRDWFASYVYLPRLRDDATLDGALQRLIEDIAYDFAFASAYDEGSGEYDGVVDGKAFTLLGFEGGLLVRRNAIPEPVPEPAPGDGKGATPPPTPGTDPPVTPPPEPEPRPTRFFASLEIDSDKAGLEVARIMDGLLVELTRTPGSTLRLTLEIDGRAGDDGYPKDVVDTVKANARDLKLEESTLGFAED